MQLLKATGFSSVLLLALLCCGLLLSPLVSAHPFDPFAEDKRAALELVLEHMREGETHEALLQVDDAIVKFPKHGPFYALKGQILMRAGRMGEAAAPIEKAIELDPDYGLSYWLRGLLRQHRGQYEAAIADFDETLKRENQAEALIAQAVGSRGMALVDLGRYEAALADLDRAIEARPQAVAERQFRAMALLALARADKTQLGKARAEVDALLARGVQDGVTRRLQGQVALAQGDPRAAVAVLDGAIKENPKDPLAFAYRAQARAALKQTKAARRDRAQACKLGHAASCTPEKKP